MASDNATGAPTAGGNDNVTGPPSARGSDKRNRVTCCSSLYKFGGQGVHDAAQAERALRVWDDAANMALAKRLKQQILELGHYSRMVERIPRRTHEITRDGVLISTGGPPGRRFQVVVPCPAPNEPATTVADCGPEDLPSP